ncbi:hypothetical protein JCM8202v2_004577 [Rhodotorula sphaerocarpa]
MRTLPFQRESPFVSLTSLALAPPHRPAVLYEDVYSPILRSHSWVRRYAVLQELGDPDASSHLDGRRGVPRGHTVIKEAYGSTGCVNASAWESRGAEARLATAGDDTKICIWSPGIEGSVKEHGGDVQAPDLGYGLTETIDTGHRANIFDVAWAPNAPTQLFSVAGDQTHYEDASACTRVFRCHTDRVKRIATEASPHVFLTCGEDGTDPEEAGCPLPLASYPSLSLYSLSLSLLRPHLFVVAGTSSYAYLHDRRMVRKATADWNLSSALADPNALTQCVRRFGVPNSVEPWKGDISKHIVSARLSPDRPRDLLVSYSDDGMYLFDTDAETYVRPARPAQPAANEMWRGGETEAGSEPMDEDGGRSEPEATSADPLRAEEQHVGDDEENLDGAGDEETGGDDDHASEEDGGNDDDEDESDEDVDFDPFVPNAIAPAKNVPLVAPWRKYEGHANSQTVKDCNFMFGDLVVSGSDDGNWFAYDRQSGEIRGIFKGDSSVVNVLNPHPKLPIVAISGIDEVVKLFGPTSDPEVAAESNMADQFETIKARNARGEGRARFGSSINAERLLQMLFARAGAPGMAEDDDEESEGEAGEGREGEPRRRIRIVRTGEAGGEVAQDCVVM